MVVCRPSHQIRGIKIKNAWSGVEKILCYEVPGTTNWSGRLNESFNPTEYNVISEKHLQKKIQAYNCYRDEVRPDNHPRSINSLKTVARFRGNSVSVGFAESFVLIRNIMHEY